MGPMKNCVPVNNDFIQISLHVPDNSILYSRCYMDMKSVIFAFIHWQSVLLIQALVSGFQLDWSVHHLHTHSDLLLQLNLSI